MDLREILIANTKTQQRTKLITNAETLKELKDAMDAKNIDYSGMTFTEGISKTQLLDDATQLPKNVMYKGQPTNNLVILLTNTKKNIASGADRKEIYNIIKENGLSEDIKKTFGRNFTQVPTDKLQKFLDGFNAHLSSDDKKDAIEGYDDNDEEETDKKSNASFSVDTIVDTIVLHIIMLKHKNVLTYSNLHEIANRIFAIAGEEKDLKKEVSLKPVSTSDGIDDDDIDDMIYKLGM